ncbi:hypothetical protein TWF694_002346 [Orbilia ellipsospora]|uniref:Glycosyl transferase CAP10 domain-containing protein n=1 Tax=Orbilia ellipsospora TaxID=2528407 RepID=A0AAV9X1T1_9PEZI
MIEFQLDLYNNRTQLQSKSFKEVVQKYRRKNGRHPPPKFDQHDCVDFDNFDRIMDDLRPFWGIPPADIRAMVKSMDSDKHKVAILKIRMHRVLPPPDPRPASWTWRADTFTKMLQSIAMYLPNLDIAMNTLDEPRVVVPWEDIQAYLEIERRNRNLTTLTLNTFSEAALENENNVKKDNIDLGFFDHSGKPYMDLASKSCPPDSYVRRPGIYNHKIESYFKDPVSGILLNYNRSMDLCTVGPLMSNLHGFLFSSSDTIATQKLVPIFGECKVNVNNDILFPANKYYDVDDAEYTYNSTHDVPWEEKKDVMFWRGVTSDGTQIKETWRNLGRHRFVAFTNATNLVDAKVKIMRTTAEAKVMKYHTALYPIASFMQSKTDVGFNKIQWCVPDCEYILKEIGTKDGVEFADVFKYKFLPDLDGHSFSGRWHAFLKSRSVSMKATIFKEWHDERLKEWVHFVPLSYRFDELYTVLTYFMGLEKEYLGNEVFHVPKHDATAEGIAERGREWASKVLRKEDIEIYMLRLMLEYARVVDDNRDTIGYSGDGSEVDKEFETPESQ